MKGRPAVGDYSPYFETYVSKVEGDDILSTLRAHHSYEQFERLTEEQWLHSYAPGKWNLKEVLIHIMDTERIFAYRALRISRNDKAPLQGFEQDDYVPYYEVADRTAESLLAEFRSVRTATLAMFENFSPEHFRRKGIASNNEVSVLALAFMIAGHENHHIDITNQNYLS